MTWTVELQCYEILQGRKVAPESFGGVGYRAEERSGSLRGMGLYVNARERAVGEDANHVSYEYASVQHNWAYWLKSGYSV